MQKDTYAFAVSAAGRVNLIGEHIDYNGGLVLPCALSLKNTVYVRPNGTDKINLAWTDISDKITIDIARADSYKDVKYANYYAACVCAFKEKGLPVLGCDVLSDCTVPFGSGLSSSAAIEVSFLAALTLLAGQKIDNKEVALMAWRAETAFVGMNCGVMDQFASACGKKGKAMLLNCATLSCEYVPADFGDYVLVIANSNKPHSLVVSKYNQRRAECEAAFDFVKRFVDVPALALVPTDAFEALAHLLDPVLEKRARHVVYEMARVKEAVQCLKRGDVKRLGELLRASHASLRDLYEVTGAELDALADAANAFPACLGSRMTGGGFGGSTVSVVKRESVEEFKTFVSERYQKAVGYAPDFYVAEISDGITVFDPT